MNEHNDGESAFEDRLRLNEMPTPNGMQGRLLGFDEPQEHKPNVKF
jgi:hypothetical protein